MVQSMTLHTMTPPLDSATVTAVRKDLHALIDARCDDHAGVDYLTIARARSPRRQAELLKKWNSARAQLACALEPEAAYLHSIRAARLGVLRTARGTRTVEYAALTWQELAALWPETITPQGMSQLYRRGCSRHGLDPDSV